MTIADDDLYQQAPPHDLAAEQVTLGGMMMSREAILYVMDTGCVAGDFYRQAHQVVAEAILWLFERGDPADVVAVGELLTRRGMIGKVGGAPYLHTLIASVPSAANAGYYARIVRDRGIVRRMIEAGTRIVQIGCSADGDASELAARGAQEWETVLRMLPGGNLRQLGPDIGAAIEHVRAEGIRFGFADLDALTGGLQPGQMIVVAARPAIGKSTLLLDVARCAAFRDNLRVGYFSLEMPRVDLITRAVAAQARVNYSGLRDFGKTRPRVVVSDEEWARIAEHMAEMADAPLFIDDTPNMSLQTIFTEALKQGLAGTPFDLIIIDYLQLLEPVTPPKGRVHNRQEEVSVMARTIKLMAKKLGIPIMVAAQLNRGPEQRADHRPLLADLRESGSVEQDADLVLLLHREDAYERESPRAGEADLIVAKHRNGPCATVTVAFQGHYSRFMDMARI